MVVAATAMMVVGVVTTIDVMTKRAVIFEITCAVLANAVLDNWTLSQDGDGHPDCTKSSN